MASHELLMIYLHGLGNQPNDLKLVFNLYSYYNSHSIMWKVIAVMSSVMSCSEISYEVMVFSTA